MKAGLVDATNEFLQWVELPDSIRIIPEILIVDDYHYVKLPGQELRYKLAIGRHTLNTSAVPIYAIKMFGKPLEFDVNQIRMFSGCHGAAPFFYEHEQHVTWKERVRLEVRGLTAIRVNGIWCPDLPREPGLIQFDSALLHDHAWRALRWSREALRGPTTRRRPTLKCSALGIDEYGRMICDVKIYRKKTCSEPELLVPFATLALESGLFVPSRLVTG